MADSRERLLLLAKAKLKLRQQQESDPLDLENVQDEDTELIETMRPTIMKMESGGRYDIYHPKTKSGKQALGAYGVVPDFWFERFPNLGLKNDTNSKKKYIDTPALQDSMFTEIMKQGIKEVGKDPVKLRAWYYGGPKAVKNLEQGTGHAKQVAYDDNGNEIAMPSHANDSDIFKKLYEGDLNPEEIQTLDTRALAGLPPLAYPNREAMDPANILFNDPEAQAQAVQEGQQQAISELPLREQMGSGLGAFAYKFPGMGTLADLSGLAPKGVNKKEEIEQYNRLRTGGQLAGELLPDVLTSSFGGVGAARALSLNKLATPAVRRLAEGAAAGGVSAASHQLQNLGSGQDVNTGDAALEIAISSALPVVGGVLGDALKVAAPKVLRRTIRPYGASEEKVYKDALEENLVPILGGVKGTQARVDKRLTNLSQLESEEALKASQRPINVKAQTQNLPAAATPKPMKGSYQPILSTGPNVNGVPLSNLAQQIPVKPANHPTNPGFIGPKLPPKKVQKPKLNFYEDAETLARKDAEQAAKDLADRKAAAEARRNPKPKEPEIKIDLESPKSKKQKPELSGAEKRQSYLQDLADEGALKDAFEAEKSLKLIRQIKAKKNLKTVYHGTVDKIDKFKGDTFFADDPKLAEDVAQFHAGMKGDGGPVGQQLYKGKLRNPERTFDFKNREDYLKYGLKPSDFKKAQGNYGIQNEILHEIIEKNPGIKNIQFKNLETGSEYFTRQPDKDFTSQFTGQRGSITNPFYKAKPAPFQGPMQQSRKINFMDKPMKRVKDRLQAEKSNPNTKTLTDEEYDKFERTLDKWEANAKGRPSAQGNVKGQMTVEDALALSKVIEKELGKSDNGSNRASKYLLEELNAELESIAPKVREATKKIEKITPFKKAVESGTRRADIKEMMMPMSIKLSGLATGSILGASNAEKGKRISGAAKGAVTGLLLSQLASTPGGAALLFKSGKALADRTTIRGNTLAQLGRSGYAKKKEKK